MLTQGYKFGFCALPDALRLGETVAWRKRVLKWAITGALPGIPPDVLANVYGAAWAYWMNVCGITAQPTTNAREADVLMGSGSIDGHNGTLAWSELPNGADTPIRQMYDTAEVWSTALLSSDHDPQSIPLLVTACHEVGHALGLGHSNDPTSLMYPALNVAAWGPQSDDIREAQARYGPGGIIPSPPATEQGAKLVLASPLPAGTYTLRRG